jgi:hypothetical protein
MAGREVFEDFLPRPRPLAKDVLHLLRQFVFRHRTSLCRRRERLGDGRGFISQTIDVTHERDRAIESGLEDVHQRMTGAEARIERQHVLAG